MATLLPELQLGQVRALPRSSAPPSLRLCRFALYGTAQQQRQLWLCYRPPACRRLPPPLVAPLRLLPPPATLLLLLLLQGVCPGDVLCTLPDTGVVRIGGGVAQEGGRLVAVKPGRLQQAPKTGKVWVESRQRR